MLHFARSPACLPACLSALPSLVYAVMVRGTADRYMAPYLDVYEGLHEMKSNSSCVHISKCVYPVAWIFPLSTVTMHGLPFKAPARPEAVLEHDCEFHRALKCI